MSHRGFLRAGSSSACRCQGKPTLFLIYQGSQTLPPPKKRALMSAVGWVVIQQVHLLSQWSLANASANRNRKEWGGCWCVWEHFAQDCHFSQKLKLFKKYMNFFIKRIVIFRTKGEAGVFREAVMTLPPLMPGALHAHLGAQSICPILQVHFGVRTGEEPRNLAGALAEKLEKLPSDAQTPQASSQISREECGALLWV